MGNRKAEFLGDGAGTVPTIVAMMGVFSLRKTVRCGVQPYTFTSRFLMRVVNAAAPCGAMFL